MRLCALLVCGALFAAGCTSATDEPLDSSEPATTLATDSDTDSATPATDAEAEAAGPVQVGDDSSYIFDQNELRTYELNLSEEALAEIDADPTAEEYVEGSMTFEGTTIEPVGIRYKGSVGAFVGCVDGPQPLEPSGSKVCTKLSMKVKINWDDTDSTFYGQKKLQFHSQNLDPSQLHERLGYWLFREMGVPAPRSVHARLLINGEYVGLFALTEQIDGRFARQNFQNGTGNVYKEVWPIDADGDAFDDDRYVAALKTNEDSPNVELIRAFGNELSESEVDEIGTVIDQWMDVEETLALVVVDRTIRNDDGPFHWYCFDGPCANHNYYWYEDPITETFHLVPWDLDNAFENIVFDANPVTPIADEWGEITNDCKPFEVGGFGFRQRSAACDVLTRGWTQFEAEYRSAIDQFLAGPFADETVDGLIDTWTAQIRTATEEAEAAHDDAVFIRQWEAAVFDLRTAIDVARDDLESRR